jgi:hypothetical protein
LRLKDSSHSIKETGDDSMITVKIQIGSKIFTAKLFDNASSQALLAKMPITMTMSELNENEKYYNMPYKLPTNSQQMGSINAGDLMLYGSDCLVLFYKSFNTSYSYTRLGAIEDVSGLVNALGNGSVQVTFSLTM